MYLHAINKILDLWRNVAYGSNKIQSSFKLTFVDQRKKLLIVAFLCKKKDDKNNSYNLTTVTL